MAARVHKAATVVVPTSSSSLTIRRFRVRENTTMSTGGDSLRKPARTCRKVATLRTSSPRTILRSIGPCGLVKPYWYHVARFESPAVTVCRRHRDTRAPAPPCFGQSATFGGSRRVLGASTRTRTEKTCTVCMLRSRWWMMGWSEKSCNRKK